MSSRKRLCKVPATKKKAEDEAHGNEEDHRVQNKYVVHWQCTRKVEAPPAKKARGQPDADGLSAHCCARGRRTHQYTEYTEVMLALFTVLFPRKWLNSKIRTEGQDWQRHD